MKIGTDNRTLLTDKVSINPFKSFWMAGFECTDKVNAFGNRVDFLQLTGHLKQIDQDYQRLIPFRIQTVREGIRWSQVERIPYQYDWTTVDLMLKRGKANGVQQVWDLCHFGFPDDLTPLHPMFARRFSSLCKEFILFYRSKYPDDVIIVTPINEVSFLSWLGGDVKGTVPYCTNQGWEVKYGLMRAYIEGVAALREADASVRILTTEPLIQIVPPFNATEQQIQDARNAHLRQFQSVDMLSGKMCPELGGSPDYLDILGFNFYYDNRWTEGVQSEVLCWNNLQADSRWLPLSTLLLQAYQRYHKPIVLSETSHPGIDRPKWIQHIAKECIKVLKMKVPFWGVCLYPIVDRPCWDKLTTWHKAGLWDAEQNPGENPRRILYKPYANALLDAQQVVDSVHNSVFITNEKISI